MKHKVLIVGLGKIALGFDLIGSEDEIFSHTKAFLNNGSFDLVGGVDSEKNRRDEFEIFSGKKAFANIDDAFNYCDSVDVISICTPTHVRLPVFLDILKFKPKLVIVEKPISSSVEEALEIKSIAAANGIKLYINYMRRVEPCFVELKNSLFGTDDVSSVIVHYTNGLFTNASHFINLMLFFFKKPSSIIVLDRQKTNNDYAAHFIMKYDGFSVYFVTHKNIDYSLGELDIVCNRKRYCIYDWGFKAKFFESVQDPLFPELKTLKEANSIRYPQMNVYMKHVVEHIGGMLLRGDEYCDVEDAVATTEICEYIKNASVSI